MSTRLLFVMLLTMPFFATGVAAGKRDSEEANPATNTNDDDDAEDAAVDETADEEDEDTAADADDDNSEKEAVDDDDDDRVDDAAVGHTPPEADNVLGETAEHRVQPTRKNRLVEALAENPPSKDSDIGRLLFTSTDASVDRDEEKEGGEVNNVVVPEKALQWPKMLGGSGGDNSSSPGSVDASGATPPLDSVDAISRPAGSHASIPHVSVSDASVSKVSASDVSVSNVNVGDRLAGAMSSAKPGEDKKKKKKKNKKDRKNKQGLMSSAPGVTSNAEKGESKVAAAGSFSTPSDGGGGGISGGIGGDSEVDATTKPGLIKSFMDLFKSKNSTSVAPE